MAKDLKYLYFELLEYLSDYGIGIEANIKDLCSQYAIKNFDNEPTVNDAHQAFSKRWDKITSVLDSVQKQGYIKYSTTYGDFDNLYIPGGNFSVSITKEGIDYYYAHILRKATIRSLDNQKVVNLITWAIAILAILGTIGMGIYSTNQSKDLSQQLDSLKQEVHKLKASQHSVAATHKTGDTTLKKK